MPNEAHRCHGCDAYRDAPVAFCINCEADTKSWLDDDADAIDATYDDRQQRAYEAEAFRAAPMYGNPLDSLNRSGLAMLANGF